MSEIKEFIKNKLMTGIIQYGVMIVYDPDIRYRELCLEISSEDFRVIDASISSIQSRETALNSLMELGQNNPVIKGMLVYVPTNVPLTEQEKQRDPYSIYIMCGKVFPDGDGEDYINLCIKAKPDHTTQIRKIFMSNSNPSFSVIDAISTRKGWPNLQDLLKVDSTREIIIALLAPTAQQEKDLINSVIWISEAKELLYIAFDFTLNTKSKNWKIITNEIWRYLLFSEFTLDLPEKLPDVLTNIPHAKFEASALVKDICSSLRNDLRTQQTYIDSAELIEQELELARHCKEIKDLGSIETFPIEEQYVLENCIKALNKEDLSLAREIMKRHENSVWKAKGESQVKWSVVRTALNLIEVCIKNETLISEHSRSQDSLITFYIGSFKEVDRMHREFEQAAFDYVEILGEMSEVVDKTRRKYELIAGKVQLLFIRFLENTGWPSTNRLSNIDVFDKLISPKLKESGKRVAFFLIDALRYELGASLEKELSEVGQTELLVSQAQLPSITKVGMASLLPEAGLKLELYKNEKNELLPKLGESIVSNVNQRMEVFRKLYGDRFFEMSLKKFNQSTELIPNLADLLVIRSEEIDAQFENDPELALGQVSDSFKRIRVAIHKLKNLGFHEVVIATDHGFVLNVNNNAGNVCTKPTGNWINLHERSLLGDGKSDSTNFVISTEKLGIRGDFNQLAGPRNLVSYRSGMKYFHGGASIQETILPVITLRFMDRQNENRKPEVNLSYKNGSKRITTRLPVMEVSLEYYDLFNPEFDFEILLEAYDKKGTLVGEAKPGGPVNSVTGTLHLKPGERLQIPIKMNPDFEGKFTLKAMNPSTLMLYYSLEFETDYVV